MINELRWRSGAGVEAHQRPDRPRRPTLRCGPTPASARVRFSYDLVLNIFIPGTPLHDGAVIISGERIAAASCFLPLTTRHELSSELGSRHRAAIGLTEESDALVIVVSEETGIISLAVEQQLLRPLDETTLRNALAEHLYQLRPRRELDS
jgi:diadenylate cyclase